MSNSSKKEKIGTPASAQKSPPDALAINPTMPYYCTWIPGACPTGNSKAALVVPPLVYHPAYGMVHPTYLLALNCWKQKVSIIVTPPTEEIITPPTSKPNAKDNLKLIEGIGPKIEGLLNQDGIFTWLALSNTPVKKLRDILTAAGNRYAIHDPKTWAKQARMAAAGKMEELKTWQKVLKGGK